MYDTHPPPDCTLSGLSALLHLLQWHKSIRFSQSYGRHTCPSDGLKGCIGKDSKPNRRLLKELSPHYASMHPKAVTDYLVDIIKLNLAHLRHSSLISRVPLLELRENSALTPPYALQPSYSVVSAPFKAFFLPFSGYVMTICYRLVYSKTCLKSVLFCLFLLNFFVT